MTIVWLFLQKRHSLLHIVAIKDPEFASLRVFTDMQMDDVLALLLE